MENRTLTSSDKTSGVRIPWSLAVRIKLMVNDLSMKDLADGLQDSGFKYTRNYISSVVYGRVISDSLHRKISEQLGLVDDDFITVTPENYAKLLS